MAAIPGLVTPYNTGEFYAMTKLIQKHDQDIHDDLYGIAVDLRKLLANPSGTKHNWARLDLRLNAMRVTRHIEHAAALHLAAAKSENAAYRTYVELYTNQPSTPRGRTFVVN